MERIVLSLLVDKTSGVLSRVACLLYTSKPLEIKPYERNAATKIIEDFMLIANETVAEDYFWQELPFLYRTHDNPDPEKMKSLATFINNFGYSIRFHNGEVYPQEEMCIRDSCWEAKIPSVEVTSTIGSGDSTVAGFAIGLRMGWSMEEIFRFSMACGIANAMEKQVGRVDPERLEMIKNKINIENIPNKEVSHL